MAKVSFISFVKARGEVVAADGHVANPDLLAVGDEQRSVVGPHVEDDGVIFDLRPLFAGPDAEPVVAQEVEQPQRGDLHQFEFHFAVEERLEVVLHLLLLHGEQADFRIEQEAALFHAAAQRLEVPDHFFQREGNLLLGLVLDDGRDAAGLDRRQLDEFGQRGLPRQTHRHQVRPHLIARKERFERLPDEFVGHGVGLTEQLGMRHIVEGGRHDLLGGLRVSQTDRLQSGLPDLDAPHRLNVCHRSAFSERLR